MRCSFTFAATVGSLWRATPQTGQRLRCAEFSWYGPSGVRQSQCHRPGFSLIRRLGWTFELNTTNTAFLSSSVFGDGRGHGTRPLDAPRPVGPSIV